MANGDLSRRRFLGSTAGTVVGAVAGGTSGAAAVPAQAQTVDPPAGQDLVLVNGRIHTVDARNSVARTMAIRNGRVASIGDAAPARRPGDRLIDLGGRTVVPGLIEPHVHIVSLANRPGYHTILENTRSIREVQDALAARRKDVPPGQWITSMGGWHPYQWAERRHPTRQELDEAVPDRPVLLYERFTGPCATNSMGKAYFDMMDAATPVHPDLKTVKAAETGAIAAAGF